MSDGQIIGSSGAGVGLPGASTQFGTPPPNSGLWTYATLPAAASYAAGTLVYTVDQGFVYSSGVAWIQVGGAGIVVSPDGSINVSGYPGNALSLTISSAFYGAFNLLPDTFLYANLPSAASNFGLIARTSDTNPVIGPVFSNGVTWLPLYNQTSGVLQISTGTPLPSGANGAAYSVQLTASGLIGTGTWSLVGLLALTGTPNTFLVNSTGLLTCADPINNSVTGLIVQVGSPTQSPVQKFITVQIVASVSPAATPTFSPVSGNYVTAQNVAISCATSGSTIYYTTNGSTPSVSSSVYSSPINVSAATTLQAIATAPSYTQSAVGSAVYTFNTSIKSLGMNLAGAANYYNPEQPFINLMKMAGSNTPYVNWFTTTGSGDSGQENLLTLDSDGYPTILSGNGLSAGTTVFVYVNYALGAPPGISSLYPTGSYTLQFQGAGTIVVGNDVQLSSLATSSANVSVNTSTGAITSTMAAGVTGTVTFNVPTATTSGMKIGITVTDPSVTGNYIKAIALVLTSNMTAYSAGAIFNPTFIAALTQGNLAQLRFMDWLATNYQYQTSYNSGSFSVSALASTPTSGATTVLLASGWKFPTNTNWTLSFTNGQDITGCTCTAGSTAVTLGSAINSTAFGSTGSQPSTTLGVSIQKNFSDRPLFSNCFWSTTKGVPLEVCAMLANQLGINPWFNVPASASNAYITAMANLLYNGSGTTLAGFAGLNSNLKATIELGNEFWNTAGPIVNSYIYASFKGFALFPTQTSDQFDCVLNWYGSRVANIGDLFSAVYGSSMAGRILLSMGGQAANTYIAKTALSAPFWVALGNTAPYPNHYVGSIHIAPYFGGAFSTGDYATLTSQADGGLSYFFQSLSSNTVTGGSAPGTLSSVPTGGWFNASSAIPSVAAHVSAMTSYGNIPVLLYEAGQTFNSSSQATLNTAANRDARMGSAYSYYFTALKIGGASTINVFDFVYEGNGNGYNWGCFESIQQYSATVANEPAKWQSVVNFNSSYQYNFNPGDYMESININGTGSSNQSEMNVLATGLSTATGVKGYMANYTWASLEPTQGSYATGFANILADYNYLQSKNPGARFMIGIISDYNTSNIKLNAIPGHTFSNQIVPNYILNCGGTLNVYNTATYPTSSGATTAYTLAAQANGQYGYGFSQYVNINSNDPTQSYYTIAASAFWDPGVNAAWINFWNALSQFAAAKMPFLELVRNGNEVSYNLNQGAYTPQYTTSANQATVTNVRTNYQTWATATAAAFPHTMIGIDVTYIVTGSDGSTETSDVYNTNTGILSASKLGGIQGLMLLTSDTFGASWTLHYNQNLGPQSAFSLQAFIGVSNPAQGNTAVIPYPPVNPSKAGVMPIGAQIQTPDYGSRMYATATQSSASFYNTAAGVSQIIQAANGVPPSGAGLSSAYTYGASHRLWTSAAAPDYSIADWGSYIQPTFSTGIAVNATRPSNLP